MKFAGIVEYDGSEFAGWAAQPGHRTVEGVLREALEIILRQPVKISVAGRTDAGVHATDQVVSFSADTGMSADLIAYKTSAVLPEDVALRRCVPVEEGFDARKSARSRSYEYRIVNSPVRSPLHRRYATYIAQELDFEVLLRAAASVQGTHNFRAFTPSKTYHQRFERVVAESKWSRSGDLLTYSITADSFLYGMVRTLVGTMLEMARGERELVEFESLLDGGERKEAGSAAPARGLILIGVSYAGLKL